MIEPRQPARNKDVLGWCLSMWDYIRSIRPVAGDGVRLKRGPSGTIISIAPRPAGRKAAPAPFECALIAGGTAEAPEYKVTVARGLVNERGTSSAQPVTQVHPPANLLDEEGKPREFPITIGQQVSLIVRVSEAGAVAAAEGDAVEIGITAEDEPSTHYDPPQGDETAGASGVYHYKLAVLRAADASHSAPWLEPYLAGSHIDHWRDLPRFVKAGGEHDIFKEFALAAGVFLTKGLSAGDGITITPLEGALEISAGQGWWGDITWSHNPTVGGTRWVTLRLQAGRVKQVFSDDGYTSAERSGTEETPGNVIHSTEDSDT